ncbi:MAG: hypothetical protein GY713_11685 [Actinomycetia bacterium]|nr:hypothetical protein [Actinomycetes bacterium]
MAHALTDEATITCPHGGTVEITSTNTDVTTNDTSILTMSDTFTISGCAFTLPGPKPSPCVRIQWVVPDLFVTVNQIPTLSRSSTGICFSADSIPQGAPIIADTQKKVETT